MSQVVDSARLMCAEFDKTTGKLKHNKFYYMDLYDNDQVRIWYGRYVEVGGQLQTQSDETFSNGRRLFDAKFKEKTNPKKGYKPQPVVVAKSTAPGVVIQKGTLADIAAKQIKTNSDEVFVLIKHLADVNVHQITSKTTIKYDAVTGNFITPYGQVTGEGINRGRDLLGEITKYLNKPDDPKFTELLEEYMMIIPQSLGRRAISPASVFPSMSAVKAQGDILDSLEASLNTAPEPEKDDDKGKEEIEKLFDCVLEIVTDKAEFEQIAKAYTDSRQEIHVAARLKLVKIYRVRINHMAEAYENRKIRTNEYRLWHGTGPANILSILKSGYLLQRPAAAAYSGNNFGPGLYFANASTKSLNYAHGYHSGSYVNKCFLFFNDVSLGNYYTPKHTTSSPPPAGYDSYWAKRGESGHLINDEIIISKSTSQINPVYLLEFEDR